ncbi:MAG: AhpC/TSA family protein [Ferruginibacter sp.]|nr:AhpC/TSA family protein [Cytophagales bacterium]
MRTKLERKKAELTAIFPASANAALQQSVEDLRAVGLGAGALRVGDSAPDFSLKNTAGREVSLRDALKNGPVVVTFYRGGWCPYCNVQLNDLQRQLGQIQAFNGEVLAISPEVPAQGLATTAAHGLKFEVLTDEDNRVARLFGLVFTPPDYLREAHEGLGIDLVRHNGNEHGTLPLPATYVIDPQGRIAYAFVEEDFTQRAETEDVVAAVQRITNAPVAVGNG